MEAACLPLALIGRTHRVSAGLYVQAALAYVREAVAMAHAQGHSFYETIARTNLVSILIELGEHAEARVQAARAKALAKAHGYRNLEVNNDAQMAEVVRAQGLLDLATSMM